jgi:hypothetical protein
MMNVIPSEAPPEPGSFILNWKNVVKAYVGPSGTLFVVNTEPAWPCCDGVSNITKTPSMVKNCADPLAVSAVAAAAFCAATVEDNNIAEKANKTLLRRVLTEDIAPLQSSWQGKAGAREAQGLRACRPVIDNAY